MIGSTRMSKQGESVVEVLKEILVHKNGVVSVLPYYEVKQKK